MAELNPSPSRQAGRRSVQRMPLHVDLTAMVDLAFLLITFFMLTTTLNKQKAMPLAMPVKGPEAAVPETRTMTICLGKANHAVWYLGLPDKPLIGPTKVGYGKDLTRAIVETGNRIRKSSGEGLIVVIKPSDHSVYGNLVETLDQLDIAQVPSYAITQITSRDIDMLKQQGVY
jgi:biopolymer transport protein ExbD